MRKPEPQVDEGGQQPVGEDQLLLTARPSRPAPGTPAPLMQRGLAGRCPPGREFLEQIAEMRAGDPGQGRMGAGCTGPGQLHNLPNPYGPSPVTA